MINEKDNQHSDGVSMGWNATTHACRSTATVPSMIAFSHSRPADVMKAWCDVERNNGEECELFLSQV